MSMSGDDAYILSMDYADEILEDIELIKLKQDSCYCTLLNPYTPVVGESVPFSRYSGNMNVENGLVTVKPGQRVQINVGIGYQDSTSTTFGNINFNVRDVTNDIWIGNINVFQGNERYEPRQTVSCQYTNGTNSDCKIGVVVRNINEIDILWPNYCWMTVHELTCCAAEGTKVTINDENIKPNSTWSSEKIARDYSTKEYVAEQISNAVHLVKEIVDEPPTVDEAKENVIYMVKDDTVTSGDVYKEYQLINGAVVQTGDTSIDLSGYAKLEDIENGEILHTDLSGNLAGITTVLDLVNALLEEYRTERKNVRFESGSYSNTNLTDLPQPYGYLTIKVGGTNILEVTFAYSNLGFKKMYLGFLARTSTETLYSSLDWEEVNTGVKEDIPIIENGKDIVYHKITKNRSITELEAYTDPNGGTGYKIDDLYLTYDCEKLAKGFDDWLAEKGITPVKGTTYEDVAQIKVYSPSAGGYVYLSTHIKFDGTTYLAYNIKYNDTDYAITSVQYDYDNGKTPTTFTGLNVLNIAKIIPELAGCYIQSDILDVLHNWFELYKPIGLEDSVGLYSKTEALLNQDLNLNTSIDSKIVGSFDLGNIVSFMTSPLQKLLFSVDSEGNNLKAFANDEKKRTTPLTSGFFGNNLLAPKNIFSTLNDMSTLPTPPDGALGIWTVVPDATGQPETTNKGGTLIIAHITSMLYSQTINYIGTRIAIYVTQGAIYYALGYGGKYYPTASWKPASGGAFRWYKISSTLI